MLKIAARVTVNGRPWRYHPRRTPRRRKSLLEQLTAAFDGVCRRAFDLSKARLEQTYGPLPVVRYRRWSAR